MPVESLLEQARAAIKAGDAVAARRVLGESDPTDARVLETTAQASYLEQDYRAAIQVWESAYPAYHAVGDRAGAVRVARTLACMYYAVIGDLFRREPGGSRRAAGPRRLTLTSRTGSTSAARRSSTTSATSWPSSDCATGPRRPRTPPARNRGPHRGAHRSAPAAATTSLGTSHQNWRRTDVNHVRRDHRRRPVRRLTNRHAAGPAGHAGAARRPREVSQRHRVHPGDPRARVTALQRWGLLDQIAKQTPPMEHYSFDFGPVVITGTARTADGISTAYAPRRTLLDKLLIDAAADAGAEVREGFSVDEILFEDGAVVGIQGRDTDGMSTAERARVVIGADGRNSRVARAVGAQSYHDTAPLQIGYYSYWRDVDVDGFETYIRPDRGFAAIPTNDDLTLIVAGWPIAEREANRVDIEGNFYSTLDLAPAFAERVRAATRVERFVGGSVPNYFRQPYGPGWVLIGDAGYCKDPITAQGIKDAFRDAEACATALGTVLRGDGAFEQVMAEYQRTRDEAALPIYGLTTEFATLQPPPAEMQQLFAAMQGNQAAMDEFVGVIAGTVSPAEFFHPDHIGQIFAAADKTTATV